MRLKNVLVFLLILTFIGCENDDNNNNNNNSTNACELDPFPGVSGVTQSNFMVQTFNEPDEKGYFITATITNDNLESVSGSPSFVFRENGEIKTYSTSNTASSTSCVNIDAESTCDFEFRVYLSQNENIDDNIQFLCFYYFGE
ncbi:hypothetical protein [Winogradskyella sp.]|uniref:hypothetical protein n=1 Tax=Winogradskyella sp. TaxID=1883156 RepID=UPI0026301CC1|nr:hypothetical protein [Winogradskyella sp.]